MEKTYEKRKTLKKIIAVFMTLVMAIGLLAAANTETAEADEQVTYYYVDIQKTISTAAALNSLPRSSWATNMSTITTASQYASFKNAIINGSYTGSQQIILGYVRYVANSNQRTLALYNPATGTTSTVRYIVVRNRINNGTSYLYGIALDKTFSSEPSLSVSAQEDTVYYGTGDKAYYRVNTAISGGFDAVKFAWADQSTAGKASGSATLTYLEVSDNYASGGSSYLDAGTYPFTVVGQVYLNGTYIDHTPLTASGTFTISKQTPAVNITEGDHIDKGDQVGVPLTATVEGLKKTGANEPTGTVTFYAGDEVIAENIAIDSNGQATCEWDAARGITKDIKVSYSGDTNYTVYSDSIEIATQKKEQQIGIEDPGKITYGDTVTLSLSETGDGTGDVTYSSSNPDILSVEKQGDEWVAIPRRPGTAVIKADKASDNTYNEATDELDLEVSPKDITFKADDASITEGESLPAFTYDEALASQDLASGDVITDDGVMLYCPDYEGKAGTYNIAAEIITIKTAAGDDVTDCYNITYEPGTLTVNAAPDPVNPSSDDTDKTAKTKTAKTVKKTKVAETGDDTDVAILGVAILAALVGAAGAFGYRRKVRNQD